MADPFPRMVDVVPEGESGGWRVQHFRVDDALSELLRVRSVQHPEEWTPPGTYARLLDPEGNVVMSDTLHERESNAEFVERARGDVLVGGLGLGMILVPVMAKPTVTSVTVVERRKEVIDLAWGHVPNPRGIYARVVEADVDHWRVPTSARWDTIYFDLWSSVGRDNLNDMHWKRRKYKNRLAPGGWLGCWMEREIRRMVRRGLL
jgi:hypothetical protein